MNSGHDPQRPWQAPPAAPAPTASSGGGDTLGQAGKLSQVPDQLPAIIGMAVVALIGYVQVALMLLTLMLGFLTPGPNLLMHDSSMGATLPRGSALIASSPNGMQWSPGRIVAFPSDSGPRIGRVAEVLAGNQLRVSFDASDELLPNPIDGRDVQGVDGMVIPYAMAPLVWLRAGSYLPLLFWMVFMGAALLFSIRLWNWRAQNALPAAPTAPVYSAPPNQRPLTQDPRRNVISVAGATWMPASALVLAVALTIGHSVLARTATPAGADAPVASEANADGEFVDAPLEESEWAKRAVWWLDSSRAETLFVDAGCSVRAGAAGNLGCWKDVRGTNFLTATGPGLRFTPSDTDAPPTLSSGSDTTALVGRDQFGGTVAGLHIFAVITEVRRGNNRAISLNGSDFSQKNRLSVHAPWSNGDFYFDGGGCCGSREGDGRVWVPVAEPTKMLIDASRSPEGIVSNLRVNDLEPATSEAGRPTTVSTGGLLIGATERGERSYQELIIFDEQLSQEEAAEIRAYLQEKWF